MHSGKLTRRWFGVLALLGLAGCIGRSEEGPVDATLEDGDSRDFKREVDAGETISVAIVNQEGRVTFLEIYDPKDGRVEAEAVEGERTIEHVAETDGTYTVRVMPTERAMVRVSTESG